MCHMQGDHKQERVIEDRAYIMWHILAVYFFGAAKEDRPVGHDRRIPME